MRAHWVRKGYGVEELPSDDVQAILYALDTPSLFGEGRFVVVRGSAGPLEAESARLAAWAETPPPTIAAALIVGRAARLRKALGARADVVEVEPPKPWEVPDWVVRHTKGRGRAMAREAAEALVEALGTDLRDLATAVEQLATATTGPIGIDTVARFFRGLETQLYTFLDAVLQRDRSGALRHLHALLRSGEHPLVLMAALAKQFRALALARDAGRANAQALAKELGVSVGYVNRAQRHGRNFDAGEIRSGFRLLADADLALKGGERGDEQPDALVMELLVADLTGEGRHTAGARR